MLKYTLEGQKEWQKDKVAIYNLKLYGPYSDMHGDNRNEIKIHEKSKIFNYNSLYEVFK